ncbi:LOW QUALITY PROTEIN: G-type lectin S-receptor-like serine/threonine-protein kinase SD2-5 [Durio zibethinus]|uniref:Receptor-like serine/threonine-protein kinase n=1 Tax=Durio zibethinus TaxID=66656 RepID=A0A6P6BFJ2_DURZI|nr:LOW QUALITY PROTEIN: G-type lectin S-receptor-like serine/threonine-protein kinase SD2-5 [Durio zibethinus]
MTMNMNTCNYFLNKFWILLIIPSSLLINAAIIEYPSFVNGPNSWSAVPYDFNFWEAAGVKPILVNGMFVCGFHCSLVGESCLFAVSIFKTSSGDNNSFSFSPQVVWSANRNNPVEYQALLQLTPEGGLILKDGDGVEVWSPNTVGKSVSRLNLSADGNLMLFDKTNKMVWQSFDYPTNSLVLGQRLVSGQKLRASVSPSNSSEGLYAFAIIDGHFQAYVDDAYSSQIYYRHSSEGNNSGAEFQIGVFGSLSVALSANFIQLGSDGYLKAYEWRESKWEGIDLFGISRCSYPLVCGKYGVCLEGGCACPPAATQSQTIYFKPINYTRPDLGCSAISPISCELSLHQSFLELQEIGYEPLRYLSIPISNDNNKSIEDCKEVCLKNCSCKAVIPISPYRYCYFLSDILSLKMYNYSDYDPYSDYGSYSTSVFIKVQNFPSAQNPKNNLSSLKFPQRKRKDVAVILGSTLGGISGVFLICTFCFLRIKKGFKEVEEDYLDNISGMPTRFSLEELKNVTKNFSNKLGEGGFGSVFQGTLPSGSEVAVKYLDGCGPVKKSFIAEVQTIGNIHHFNLVSLVGFCAEKFTRLLVYEYMCKGSLDQWIFHKNQELALGWKTRKKIILDIAKGLAYLHEDCNQKIIHLDIKPQNILLDENFNAKVSDFGLSKLIGRDQSQVITTMRGTPGYMAPEWLSSVITEKADVYSFGIVVLEILCGRKNVDGSQQEEDRHLLRLFTRKQEEGQLVDLIDRCSEDMQANAAEVMEMMKVATWCLQNEHIRRPSMSTVVKIFEGSVDFVGTLNDKFLNELTAPEAVETVASTALPSILSGPR